MKLIANSVFKLPDGNMTVPGAEIPVDSEKASEWVDKGFAYYTEGESLVKAASKSPILSDNTADGVNQNPDTANQNPDEANQNLDEANQNPDEVNQNADEVNQNADDASLIPDKSEDKTIKTEKTPADTARKPRNKPQTGKKQVKK